MGENIYNYHDPNIGLYQVNDNYLLLLQIHTGSFSYAVVYQNKLVAWCENSGLKVLNEPGQGHEFLNYDYKNVVISLPSTGFTLVPNALYNAGLTGNIARFLNLKPKEKVIAQPIDHENYIIFKVDERAEAAEKFGFQNVVYEDKGWINAITASNPPAENFYVNINKKQAAMLYVEAGKLRFYNTFKFNNPDELVYYVALVAKELQLQPRHLNVVISGDINVDDKNAGRLAEFFNGVEENHLRIIDQPDEILPHQLLSLSALSLCVSSEVL